MVTLFRAGYGQGMGRVWADGQGLVFRGGFSKVQPSRWSQKVRFHPSHRQNVSRFHFFFLGCLTITALAEEPKSPFVVAQTTSLNAPETNQAACADERYVYAIDSKAIAKYDRTTGNRVTTSTGEATHLNSGFLWNGNLYCAHSNYPRKPEVSQIMRLDIETMALGPFKNFGEYRGSLTWVVRDGDIWWCNFAHYGTDNAKTVLVKLDSDWHELGAWIYPVEVIRELGQYSISGGLWLDGVLLVTGHDHKVIYRLRLPKDGDILKFIDKTPSPFPGQGIALDPKTNGLVGIDRDKRQVIFAGIR